MLTRTARPRARAPRSLPVARLPRTPLPVALLPVALLPLALVGACADQPTSPVVARSALQPTAAPSASTVAATSARLVTWGTNAFGATPSGSGVRTIVGAWWNDVAIREDGTLAVWGHPALLSNVPSIADVQMVAAGDRQAVALRADGSLVAWGSDEHGFVGGTPTGAGFKAVGAGRGFGLAVRQDGSIAAWGNDLFGVVSNVPAGTGFKTVTGGFGWAVALREDGTIAAWGRTDWALANVPSGSGFVAVSAGWLHGVALRADGSLVAWGADDRGQVREMPGGTGFTAVTAADGFSAALRADGRVATWGTISSAPPAHVRGFRAISGATNRLVTLYEPVPDDTPPAITFASSRPPNDAGWFGAGPLGVSWGVSDPETLVTASSCPGLVLRTDTPGIELTCTATSHGGTDMKRATVRRDGTPPTIAPAGLLPAANAGGWANRPVTVTWSCSDVTSGPVSESVTQSVSADGAGQSATGTCADRAGNTAQHTQTGINVDQTAPTLSATLSAAVVPLGGTLTASPGASDALSGVASEECGTVVTTAAGPRSVTCTATDRAGNTATASLAYRVAYQFSGFAAPVDAGVRNVANAGRTIPLKWRLTDAAGQPVTTLATATVSVAPLACTVGAPSDAIEEYAASGSGLRHLGDGWYQLNWSTPKSYAGTCRTLRLDLGEGAPRTAEFDFR